MPVVKQQASGSIKIPKNPWRNQGNQILILTTRWLQEKRKGVLSIPAAHYTVKVNLFH
jgi:hypothetical protein